MSICFSSIIRFNFTFGLVFFFKAIFFSFRIGYCFGRHVSHMHNCLHFSDMFQVSLELKKKGFYIFIITYHKSELLRPACNNYSSPVSVSLFLLIHIVLCNLNILYGPLRFLFKNGKQGIAASRARSSSFLIVQVFLNKSLRSIGQLSLGTS